jgi:hypothetical protein
MFALTVLGIMGTTISIMFFLIGFSGIARAVRKEMGKDGAPDPKNVSTFRKSVLFLCAAWLIMTVTVMVLL